MLPLIPALILLLLQGPVAAERLAQDGRLPQALDAMQRRLDSTAESRALESLIEASKDPRLSQALLQLLGFVAEPPKPSADLSIVAEKATVGLPPQIVCRLSEGFERGQRSRDGPA